MKPLLVKEFTATSCIGRGLEQTLDSLLGRRSGLKACEFETVRLDTHIGEVSGVDNQRLAADLSASIAATIVWPNSPWRKTVFSRRSSRRRAAADANGSAYSSAPAPSGILETELAYRERDPLERRAAGEFRLCGTHNSFSVADYLRRRLRSAKARR